jgi:hypothetical protein
VKDGFNLILNAFSDSNNSFRLGNEKVSINDLKSKFNLCSEVLVDDRN